MNNRSKKRGFSLGEILVAVAIMAVVAAVVIPTFGGQLNKGESARISSDLVSIRSAVEQFLADVRRYPSAMSSLQVKPGIVAPDSGLTGGLYTASQLARWKGPYLTKDIVREQGGRLLSERFVREKLHVRKTGGSTGPTTPIYYDDEALDWSAAVNLAAREWAGKSLGMKEVHLASRFPEVFLGRIDSRSG